MATNTYYSPFYPSTLVVGKKGSTIGAVPSAIVGGIQDDLDKVKDQIKDLEDGGGVDTIAPGVPTNLLVTSVLTDVGVTLTATWTAPTDNDVAGYDFAINENGGSFIQFTTSGTIFERNALRRGTVYSMRVRAFDKAGNKGPFTNTVTYTTIKDSTPPAAPSSLTAQVAYNTANVLWTNPSDTDFEFTRIFFYDSQGNVIGTRDVFGSPSTNGNSFFTALTKATPYSFTAQAFDTSGNGSAVTAKFSFTTAGGIDVNDFTPDVRPINYVDSLPNPAGYTGPALVYDRQTKQLYSYANGKWVSASSVEIAPGSIGTTQLADLSVVASKIKVTMGGGNLLRNSTYERQYSIGAFGTVPQGFASYDNNGLADTRWSIVTGRYSNTRAVRVAYSSNQTSKGIVATNYGSVPNSNMFIEGTYYTVSFWARGAGSALEGAAQLAFNNTPVIRVVSQPVLKTDWQRYIFVLRWTPGNGTDPQLFFTAQYDNVQRGAGSIDFTEMQVEEGEVASGYAPALLEGEITANLLAANSVVAGKVAANAINASNLVVQSRPISVTGVNIRVDNNNILTWDNGFITYMEDDGNYATYPIAAGSTAWYGWGKGVNLCFNATTKDPTLGIFYTEDTTSGVYGRRLPLAFWNNNKELEVKAGVATIINGDKILTGTIGARHLMADSVTASAIKAGTIGTDQLAANAILASKLLITNTSTLNPDPGFRDKDYWFNNGQYNGPYNPNVYGVGWYGTHANDVDAIMGSKQYTMIWDNFSSTEGRYHLYSLIQNNHKPGATYELRARVRNASNQNINAQIQFLALDQGYLGAANIAWGPNEFSTKKLAFTMPPNTGYYRFVIFNESGSTFQGNAQVADLQATIQSGGTAIENGAITTDHITVGTLNGDRITVGTLNADRITASSLLSGTILVSTNAGQQSLDQIGTRAANPAQRINENSTLIDPGLIRLVGSTTLNNWKNGGDSTEIRGGAIAANTITANKLKIGSRGVSFQDLYFQYRGSDRYATWGGGAIFFVDDTGNQQVIGIAGGSCPPPPGGSYHYIYWNKGNPGVLGYTTDWPTATGPECIHIATHTGGSNIVQTYGGTIIDGSNITTGTVTATQLRADFLSASWANIGTLRTATSGARMELTSNQIRGYYDNNNLAFEIGVFY